MNKQQMLDAIYDKIADKRISMWCKICRYHWIIDTVLSLIDYWQRIELIVYSWINKNIVNLNPTIWDIDKYNIIWHPIWLSRVLHYLWVYFIRYKKNWVATVRSGDYETFEWILIKDWNDAILDDQSEKTIQAIYNLICI